MNEPEIIEALSRVSYQNAAVPLSPGWDRATDETKEAHRRVGRRQYAEVVAPLLAATREGKPWP